MAAYALAIFTGAFLLFQVQPLMGKYVLPWFGGAPAVWTTCMLFFQVLLLAGYGYAHLSNRWLKPRAQVGLHLGLVILGLLMLPIIPDASWKPVGTENPTLRILALLVVNVGLPYFALSATAPLIQSWFSRTLPAQSPYRLYALSNAGSLLALLSYPVIFEPAFTRAAQATAWGIGLGIYFLSVFWSGVKIWRSKAAPSAATALKAASEIPRAATTLMWLVLPFCASVLLLAITNKICQDVAVIPFLWLLPLTVYLLSFIICFDRPAWYRRAWFGTLLLLAVPLMALVLSERLAFSVPSQIALYTAGLLVASMVCHGEVYRLKPHPAYLTSFYLMIAAGGALGGVFVAFIAPSVFSDFYELHLGLLLAGGLLLGLSWKTWRAPQARSGAGAWILGVAIWTLTAGLLWQSTRTNSAALVHRARNFYGVLSVFRYDMRDPTQSLVEMMHGRTAHGMQYLHEPRSRQPTLYFSPESGIGRAFASLEGTNRHIGVVGLGAGTLAAYGQPGDRIRFYELNPAVARAARGYFTYLRDSPAEVTVVMGDARLSLEREAPQQFDQLVLDAFSGDAIPVHLLTREAFQLYRRHLKPGGLIATHISNISLNLEPVVLRQAREGGWTTAVIEQPRSDYEAGVLPSVWVLQSLNPQFTERPPIRDARKPTLQASFSGRLWSDDYTTLFPYLRRSTGTATTAKSSVFQARSAAELAGNVSAAETISRLRQELARNSESPLALNNLAVLLATAPDAELRNGGEAVRLAEKASTLTSNRHPVMLTTLAAAYAESGRFDDAVRTAEEAIRLAEANGADSLVKRNRELLEYYRRGEPYHQQRKTQK